MDPNQYNWQAYYNMLQNVQCPPTSGNGQNPPFFPMYPPPPMNFVPNYQSPYTQNSQNSETFPSIPLSNSSINDAVETQIPEFSSQIGLEEITLEEEAQRSTKKKGRVIFSNAEDIHLIGAWLNVSTDSIVGDGQTSQGFWKRVTESYNNFRDNLGERGVNQLKSRWQKINLGVQKFNGHYKQAVQLKKSGCSENDVMMHAYKIWSQDEGSEFSLEHAWRLLKDKPKWYSQFTENCSKRTKLSASGTYSSSSNPETPIEIPESDTPSRIPRPMGQKAAKRKSKGKGAATSSTTVDLTGIEEAIKEKNNVGLQIAKIRETESIVKMYEILMKDTSTMSETQLKDHEMACSYIRRKLGN